LAEHQHCEIASEAQVILELTLLPKREEFYKCLQTKLSKNTDRVNQDFFLKRLDSDNYLFRRELFTLWINIFTHFGYNAGFIRDFCNNLNIMKALLAHLNTEKTLISNKIVHL